MARTSNQTKVYEVKSRQSGKDLFVTEWALTKMQKVAGGFVRTELRSTITDTRGKTYERAKGMTLRCLESGELFTILEQVPSIRKMPA